MCFRVWDLNARQALLLLSLLSKDVYVETLKWKGCLESSPLKKLRFCKYRSWDGSVTKALCCAAAHQSQKNPKGHISCTMSSRLCMQLQLPVMSCVANLSCTALERSPSPKGLSSGALRFPSGCWAPLQLPRGSGTGKHCVRPGCPALADGKAKRRKKSSP